MTVTALLMVVLFVVNLLVPLGVAVGALYVMCLSFLLPVRRPRVVFAFAALAASLTVLTLLLTLSQRPDWMAYVNRGISVAVIGIVARVLVRYKRDRRRSELRLRESSRRLRSLTAQLQSAEERERRALADYLHDEIGQPLAHLKMRLMALGIYRPGGRDEPDYGSDVASHLDEIVVRTRKITTDLNPPVLKELGLAPAIEWLSRETCAAHGLELTFDQIGTGNPLSESASLLVYRGTRELLFNAVKHAAARRLRVRVELVDGRARIEVEDDGRGFAAAELSPGTAEGGYGLYSLRERLRLLGGLLEIDSEIGRGTRVEMVVPFDAELWTAVDASVAGTL